MNRRRERIRLAWNRKYRREPTEQEIDQAEIDAYEEVFKIILSGSLTTQAQVDARANSLLGRAKFELNTGRMYAPHDARVETYDRISIEDSRGI